MTKGGQDKMICKASVWPPLNAPGRVPPSPPAPSQGGEQKEEVSPEKRHRQDRFAQFEIASNQVLHNQAKQSSSNDIGIFMQKKRTTIYKLFDRILIVEATPLNVVGKIFKI